MNQNQVLQNRIAHENNLVGFLSQGIPFFLSVGFVRLCFNSCLPKMTSCSFGHFGARVPELEEFSGPISGIKNEWVSVKMRGSVIHYHHYHHCFWRFQSELIKQMTLVKWFLNLRMATCCRIMEVMQWVRRLQLVQNSFNWQYSPAPNPFLALGLFQAQWCEVDNKTFRESWWDWRFWEIIEVGCTLTAVNCDLQKFVLSRMNWWNWDALMNPTHAAARWVASFFKSTCTYSHFAKCNRDSVQRDVAITLVFCLLSGMQIWNPKSSAQKETRLKSLSISS